MALFAHVSLTASYGRELICYGGSFDVPIYYTPPLFPTSIYYKPKGKDRILVVNEGKSVDKRFVVRSGSIKMRDLTEQDDEAMLFFGQSDSVKLYIKDCRQSEKYYYGNKYSWALPYNTEYMEFSQMTSSRRFLTPVVIWNRTDTSSDSADARRRVKYFLLEIDGVKQQDSGYYKCLGSSGQLIKWRKLEVEEFKATFEHFVGQTMQFHFPMRFSTLPRILFTSQESGYEDTFEIENTDPRLFLSETDFSFQDLKYEDAGVYKFVDKDGDLALQLELQMEYPELSGWVYLVALVIIAFFIVCCCCCVKKCCFKKSTNKRSSHENNAPPVFHHSTTQPTQPVVPRLSREPRVIHPNPPTYNSAIADMDLPPSTQVTVTDRLDGTSTPLISNSSDSEPKFEFKGTVFPSAPPLSSGTDIQDVYTSDKLNFL